jgi:hypothetical protein
VARHAESFVTVNMVIVDLAVWDWRLIEQAKNHESCSVEGFYISATEVLNLLPQY